MNRVDLAEETILKTREWFAENARACIAEVLSGEVKVSNAASYIEWRKAQIHDALSGKYDYSFSFLQKAHFIQTGECVALLP